MLVLVLINVPMSPLGTGHWRYDFCVEVLRTWQHLLFKVENELHLFQNHKWNPVHQRLSVFSVH